MSKIHGNRDAIRIQVIVQLSILQKSANVGSPAGSLYWTGDCGQILHQPSKRTYLSNCETMEVVL